MGEIIERTVPDAPLEWTGERLTSAARGQVEIEHLHRYLLARQLARGLDVLDVASGEGYGSAFIAQTARSVTGIEIDSAAAQHAARSYQAPNLRFLEGDARALPLRDASMDLVVSFETIEHFHEHERFLAEVRRVLRPGGRLLISSPDRCIYSPPGAAPNPFHARELSESEFEALLRRHFRLVLLQGQRTVLGSALIGRSASGGGLLTFERQAGGYEASDGLPGPIYVIALASDSEAMLLPDSLLIETSALEPALTELPALRTLSERRQTALDAAGEYARRLEAGLAEHDHAAAAAQSEARALQRRVMSLRPKAPPALPPWRRLRRACRRSRPSCAAAARPTRIRPRDSRLS